MGVGGMARKGRGKTAVAQRTGQPFVASPAYYGAKKSWSLVDGTDFDRNKIAKTMGPIRAYIHACYINIYIYIVCYVYVIYIYYMHTYMHTCMLDTMIDPTRV